MTPAPPVPRWLSMLGCVLMGAAALTLSACGGGGAATADSTAATQPRQQAKPHASVQRCPGKVDVFVRSLDTLRSQLAVGLSYEQYAAKMKGLRASYDEVPVSHLTIDCLTSTGTPGEKALNEYIDAANAWGECLANASCTTASIEPVLQRKWRLASGFLSEAQ